MTQALRRLLGIAALVTLVCPALSAQSTTATIQGTVRDNQDAVVPGALVTVRNIETGATRTLTTEGNGNYRFLNMPVGNYDLDGRAAGLFEGQPARHHTLAEPGGGHRRENPAGWCHRVGSGHGGFTAIEYDPDA